MRVTSAALGCGTILLAGLTSSAWAADDDGQRAGLPKSPVVKIVNGADAAGEGSGTSESDAPDDANETGQPNRIDEFQHYIDLAEASADLDEYLDNLEYGLSNGTGALILPGLGQLTSEYGPRVHPITGRTGFHTGVDLDAGNGTIYAADNGTVVQAATDSVYGNYVVLDHGLYNGQRLTTMYAHQADLQVDVGDRVSKGVAIGEIGSTGLSTGPHLHFEVRLDGAVVNPAAFLPLLLFR